MIKAILILTPFLVTLFWSILLNTGRQKHNAPSLVLGKVMLLTTLVFLCNFIFFIPLPTVYSFVEPFYQYAGLLGYPMFYIYNRLLTIDDRFSFKKHGLYLLAPTLLFFFYVLGVLFTPFEEYRTWIFLRNAYESETFGIHYLKIMLLLIRVTFIVQIIVSLPANFILLRKYGSKAASYYSDMEDSGADKLRLMNIAMTTAAILSILWATLGRSYFMHNMEEMLPTLISVLVSGLFSSLLFVVGWLGMHQKTLNPSFELESDAENEVAVSSMGEGLKDQLLEKIQLLFMDKRVFLDSKLTIQDIAQELGTNRSYISAVINQQYNQNFCTFVNSFRVGELEKVVRENPAYSLTDLSEFCGFGTVHSMKRAFVAKKNISFPDWKKENCT